MLTYQLPSGEPKEWAREQFGGARMRDVRRQRRAEVIAEGMAQKPGSSVPALFDRRYDVKAAYGFFDRAEATPDNVQAGHREKVREAASREDQTVLMIEDSTECSWSGSEPIAGLGPIGNAAKGLQGFWIHSVLAVRWPTLPGDRTGKRPPVEVLGLADQTYHVRSARRAPRQSSSRRKRRARESQIWDQTTDRLGPAPAGTRWVRVADRGADIYEFLSGCQKAGHGFVVRAAQERALEGTRLSLFAQARKAKALGQFTLHLRARPGRRARDAHLAVAATAVLLRAPYRPGHSPGRLPPIACTVVRVFEPKPPKGVKPLEWILLCDQRVSTYDEALEVALQYSTRWLIEEFHKALKTGLGAEQLQLETAHRLLAAVAIMSVVALRLIDLRERVRIMPGAPAEQSGLTPLELDVLRARLNRPLQTVRDVALAIGRLGGHMNRKSDGLPGWKTLWLGMKELRLLVQGVHLAQKMRRFGE